ncbi:MAG: hypothetical protein MHMPM18_000224 [Marteilia pararefringens]
MGRMSFKSKGNDSKIRSTLSNSSATFRKLDSTVSDQITVINVYIKIYSLRIIKLGVDKATTVAELVQFISRYLKIRTKICHLILEKDELVGTDEEMMSPKVTMKQLQQTVNNRYANIDTGFICPAPIHLRLLISKYYQESQRKFMTTWSETQRLIICTMFFDKFIENSFTLIERDTDNYHEIVTIAGLFAREFLGVYDCQKHAGKSVYYLKFIPDLLDAKKFICDLAREHAYWSKVTDRDTILDHLITKLFTVFHDNKPKYICSIGNRVANVDRCLSKYTNVGLIPDENNFDFVYSNLNGEDCVLFSLKISDIISIVFDVILVKAVR